MFKYDPTTDLSMSTTNQPEWVKQQGESIAAEQRFEVTGVRAERFPAVAAERAEDGEVAVERRGGKTFLLIN